jgi:polysaccharide export outer membrane protein
MQSGRSCRRCWLVGLCLALVGGCASTQCQLERALRVDGNPSAHARDLEARYQLRCPDLLDVQIDGQPVLSGTHAIEPDGRLHLDEQTAVLVSGKTARESAHAVAGALHLADQTVRLRVAGYNSQSLYLFCEANGVQRVVPYRGPETILDLMQRVGLTSAGVALGDIRVVRAHVADGEPPEVFHIDLSAVLLRHDLQTNLRLEPFDRIYVGQRPSSRMECCVPPVLQPLYRVACGIK